MLIVRSLLVLCLSAFAALPAIAGSFGVSPVRVTIDAGVAIARVDVANRGTEKVVVQVQAFDWSQNADGDEQKPTNELLFNPPVFQLEPGAVQILRVALREPHKGATERTFRLHLTEVPKARDENSALNVALRISIPVFVAPVAGVEPGTTAANAKTAADQTAKPLSWQAKQAADGKLELSVTNPGPVHTQLSQISITESKDSSAQAVPIGTGYVLAGATRRWRIDAPAGTATRLQVSGQADGKQIAADLPLARD